MSLEPTTNFKDSNGVDLGTKLVTKDYLLSVYPEIAQEIGTTPELWIWGDNGQGQLGINNTITRSTPVTTFAGGTNWKQVSGGDQYTAAIKTDGTLWTWGTTGAIGYLGINATGVTRSTPVTTFAGGTNWRQVSAGTFHCAAIKTDGTLWTWGSAGSLGNNATGNRLTPVTTFAGGTNWRQVSAGYHTAATKTDGTLWTWGTNSRGELGNATTLHRSTPVTTFIGGTNWKQVSVGEDYTGAIKTDGTLWTWGQSNYGVLGTNNESGTRSTPITTFIGGTNWKQINCGQNNVAAIKTDGTLWTWGKNSPQNANFVSIFNTVVPNTTFVGGTNWKQVSVGFNHTSAIKTDGTLWVWGVNSDGQLGINNTITRSTPVTTFIGGTNWKTTASDRGRGTSHTVAIKSVDFI